MPRRVPIFLLLLLLSGTAARAQLYVNTAGLMARTDGNRNIGQLNIKEDPGIDSLMYRYILYNSRMQGIEGFRIQIFNSSARDAREESARVRASFISKFPDIVSYPFFEQPGYYKIRVGDFRTRTEGTKYLILIRREFPDAHFVPDIINFPDLNKN